MIEWEYMKMDLNQLPRKTDEVDLLNRAGGEGWELVSLMPNNQAYLKRRLDEPAPAATNRKKNRSSPG